MHFSEFFNHCAFGCKSVSFTLYNESRNSNILRSDKLLTFVLEGKLIGVFSIEQDKFIVKNNAFVDDEIYFNIKKSCENEKHSYAFETDFFSLNQLNKNFDFKKVKEFAYTDSYDIYSYKVPISRGINGDEYEEATRIELKKDNINNISRFNFEFEVPLNYDNLKDINSIKELIVKLKTFS